MDVAKTRSAVSSRTHLQLHYQVAMPQPESHLFEVTLQVNGWTGEALDLKMPVWTPGSYLVREYSRHVQDFQVEGNSQRDGKADRPLPWQKISKNHWQIKPDGVQNIRIRYSVFANELTVRTNHLDPTHGYFNGAALFFYIPGFERMPHRLSILCPKPDWRIATSLPGVEGQTNTFEAPDFDTLVDCPVEVGEHALYEFEVLGKPHQFAIWGEGNYEPQRLLEDTRKVIGVEANLFGGLPYDRYLFLLHLSAQGFGGLEHKDSCTLNYSRFGFRATDRYNRFMQLVAHEFFHLWNVKRIRPKALEVFDYEAENYTPSLWFSEGTTSYYDLAIPYRAGIYDTKTYLKELSKEITRFLTTPGRKVQPLSESSFDAWIKLYRRDANSDNNQISYYLKGEMLSLLIDLIIRQKHNNRRSLDDVMRQMWLHFGKDEIGFTPEQLQSMIESVADTDLSDFFHRFLHTTEDLPFDQYLEPFGLKLRTEDVSNSPPSLGMIVKTENGREVVKFVESHSPAQQAGIDPGDELLALDGLRVTADQLSDRLRDYHPGDTLQITFFHQDELRTKAVQLVEPRPGSYQLVAIAQPSAAQSQLFKGWLGAELATLSG